MTTAKAIEESHPAFALLPQIGALPITQIVGMMHALAVAPSALEGDKWLAVALPNGTKGVAEQAGRDIVDALKTTMTNVVEHVKRDEILAPDTADTAGCEMFARGYLLGAGLDPAWRKDAAAWEMVGWAALLTGGAGDLPPEMLAKIGGTMEPLLAQAREDMPYWIAEARKRFASPNAKKSVGRNDPCPCGSGKKFKKCCMT